MVIATDFKFGVYVAYTEYYPQCKSRSQGSKARSCGYILDLWTTVNKSETAKAMGFKISMHTFYEDYNNTNAKLRRLKGHNVSHVTGL